MKIQVLLVLVALLALPPAFRSAKGGTIMAAFNLGSPAFADGSGIPARFTCDGENLSPQLDWNGAPDSAKSFALIVDDPDAPSGTFTHWVLFDVPGSTRSLTEGQKGVGHSGRNDFSKVGYGGPCPPRGHGAHRYNFTLSALDVASLGLQDGASRQEVEGKMRGHVIGTAKMMGTYERK